MNKLQYKFDLALRFSKTQDPILYKYLKSQNDVLNEVFSRGTYILASYYVPQEILSLFDIPVIFNERLTGLACASNVIQLTQNILSPGSPPNCACSYQKYFSQLFNDNLLPLPEYLISTSYACDDEWMFGQLFSLKHNINFYLIDILKYDKEKAVQYTAFQLEDLYNTLKRQFSQIRKIDDAVDFSNETIKIKNEIDNLRMEYPGIIHSTLAFKLFTLYNDLGLKNAHEIFNDLLELARKNLGIYKRKNCIKILWLGMLPLYKNSIVTEIEKKYDCRIVYEELFDFGNQYLNKNTFFHDLSKRFMTNCFFSLDNRLKFINDVNSKLKIDGIIHFSQNNCRFLPPMLMYLQKKIEDLGIPFIEILGDAIDTSSFNQKLCFNKLDVFFETISV